MTKTLRISPELALPLDTVTSTLIVYGGKGMGKTVFGAVLAEELAATGQRWAWLDPLGVGWGIRHSADGNGNGVECLILGGAHGDIPIEPSGGAAVADVVVDENVNVLIDFSRKPSGEMWGVGEKIRFVTAYARRLFQRQGELVGGRRREPLFQMLDEGARYIPQTIPAGNPDLAMCVSAWQQFVEEGRNVGLGLCVLTQRSARISKDVAELADAMVAFRTIGPNSLGAVLDWLGEHVDRNRVKELSAQVRELQRGSALIVSPGWLKLERVVPIRMRNTFDSSATPKAGERPRTARGPGAKPDLEKIRARMAETIERAKAEDPKALRARVAQLEKELAKARDVISIPQVEVEQVPVFDEPGFGETFKQAMLAIGGVEKAARECNVAVQGILVGYRNGVVAKIKAAKTAPRVLQGRYPPPVESPATRKTAKMLEEASKQTLPSRAHPQQAATGAGSSDVGRGGLRRILRALAQRTGLTNRQLGVRAGISSKSGTFSTYLAKARTMGWIRDEGDLRHITQAGIEALGGYEPLPEGRKLLEHWLRELGSSGAARMLQALAKAYPRAMSHAELGGAADISPQSGTFSTYLAKLRTLELITGGRGEVRLSEELA